MSAQRAVIYPLSAATNEVAEARTNRQSPVCSSCFGTGMEVVPGKGARRCHCRTRDRQAKLLEQARIPPRYQRCSLASYSPALNNNAQLQAFNLAFRLTDEYPAVDRGLLLMGSCGVGKTHLAVGILRGLVEKGVTGLFYDFGALLKEIQDSYNPLSKTSELNRSGRAKEPPSAARESGTKQ